MDTLKAIKISAFIAIFGLAFAWHVNDKREAVSVAKAKVEAVYQLKLKDAQEASNRVTGAMQANADNLRQTKDEQIQTINAKLSVALSELRNRPKRPETLPDNSSNIPACTARELYREDAEFLTGEAARAESVLIERDYYYKQYQEVREKQNGTTK